MPATLDQATALVLIDLQHGITVQPTVHPSEQIVARCARLAIAFRANGKLIAATRVAFGQDPASRILARYCQYRGPGTLPGRLTLGSGEWVMAAGSEMADFVLVHSAWFGGWCWKKLVPLLAGHGHSVHTPTLTGLGDRSHLAHPGIVLQTHVDDVVNTLTYQDLRAVILVGTSSSGAVITGVADRVPDRISQLIYVDAFVPGDGQALWDLIPPQRRPAMETLVQTEGFGWLLPRFAAQPWEQFAREAWQVTDEADLTWMLTRLRPTPFGHFTSPVRLVNPAAERLPRTYIRCRGWPNPGFDRYAQTASQDPRWHLYQLDSSHLPYITNPHQLAPLLLQAAVRRPEASGQSIH